MYALVEKGRTDDFRRKHLNISFTAMALAIAVKEVFAELFSKSDRISLSENVTIYPKISAIFCAVAEISEEASVLIT